MIQVIVKVASRCNLNCSYCYVYNKGDTSWRGRPPRMSDEIFTAALDRAHEYAEAIGDRAVSLVFHGGEPTLIGPDRFHAWCVEARERLGGAGLKVGLALQTNGTLIDDRWIETFRSGWVGVGVSIDGPPQINDRARVDHRGRGSHARVERALRLLGAGGVDHGLLCVIPLGADPLSVHQHFLELGAPAVTYLWPDVTHDQIAPILAEFGPTPCADFMIPIFDAWHDNPATIDVRDLRNISSVLLGGRSRIETIGNVAPHYFFVETDGAIEGLDALRVCGEGLSATHLNVLTAGFADVRAAGGLHARSIFDGDPLPAACRTCREASTCAGGYLPHRFSAQRGFDNPSAWCADLLKLFGHMRTRLSVSPDETLTYRRHYDRLRRRSTTTAAAAPQPATH
jgi:uncharacterized protein